MRIAEGLQQTRLSYDFIHFPGLLWADELHNDLPQDARFKLERFCGETGLKAFIFHEISSELSILARPAKAPSERPLIELGPFSNSISASRKLVARLKGLPYRYRATVALPTEFSDPVINEIDAHTELGAGICVAQGNSLPSPLPLSSQLPRVDQYLFTDIFGDTKQDRSLFDDRLYFTMPLIGYATHSSSSMLCRSFEDYIKAFYGACMAKGIVGSIWSSGDERHRLPYIMVHTEGEQRTLLQTEKLEQELLDFDDGVSTIDFADKNKEDLWSNWRVTMTTIATVFAEDKDSRRLFTACIWYYRASINKRPLDKMLEATIAIEVLLGDRQVSEGVGLSNLLGNRCAFLLGKTSTQRQNILDLFGRIYALRSNIVHEGRHRLEPGERKTVNAAVALCGQIISREMDVRSAAA